MAGVRHARFGQPGLDEYSVKHKMEAWMLD